MEINIRFQRSTKVNQIEYGFDFDLFAEIEPDQCKAVTHSDSITISMQKKVSAEWIRLLASQAKVKLNFLIEILTTINKH